MSSSHLPAPPVDSRGRALRGYGLLTALVVGLAAGAPAGASAADPLEQGRGGPRLVSLAPSLTESLVFLGAADHLVGRTRFCAWPAGVVDSIPVVGGMADPELETLLARRPDVVVVSSMTPRPVVERLERLGLHVRPFEQRGIDGLLEDLEALATLARVDAATRIQNLRQRLRRLRARLAGLGDAQRPSVLVLYGLDGLFSAGAGTFPSDIITTAGGRNVVALKASTWPTLTLEQILAWDPAYILVTADHLGDEAKTREEIARLQDRPIWRNLRAVRDGRVLLMGDSVLSIPGPRTIDAVERLARLLHPERFAGGASP